MSDRTEDGMKEDALKMAATKRAPSDEYASDQEVEAAIAALSPTDVERLRARATYRVIALASTGLGMSAEDLLQEAILRTFEGRKRWRKTVSFVKHLEQASGTSRGIPQNSWRSRRARC